MTTATIPERGARDQEFDPLLVSPSRIDKFLTCGIQFKMKYLEGIPEQRSGSAALFGSVMHQGLEWWGIDRSQSLVDLVKKAWYTVTDDHAIKGFIREYEKLSLKAIALEQEIRDSWAAKGKESKAPRMTAEWKSSDVAKQTSALWGKWHDSVEQSFYRFTEFDPLPKLYDESLVLSSKYADRYGHLPPVLHSEFELREPWKGFTIRAYIDSIEVVLDPGGTPSFLSINDYKSYAQVPPSMKDWRQVVMYDAGIRSLIAREAIDLQGHENLPLLVCIDYLRWTPSWQTEDGKPFPSRRYWAVTSKDHERLLSELTAYRQSVEHGIFLPASKGQKPDYCDFPDNCCLRNCNAAGGGLIEVEVVV